MQTPETPEEHVNAAPIPSARPDRLARVPWGAVGAFIAISFSLAWLVTLPLWSMEFDPDAENALVQALVSQGLTVGMMFTPTIATLIVVFAFKVARGHRARFLGLWPLRPAKRVVWFTVAAIFAPPVIVVASVAIAAAFGWLQLDLVNFSGLVEDGGLAGSAISAQTVVALQLLLIPLGALLNALPSFGEELGWRGFLLPALLPLGTWPALVIHGAIWGLWHSPIILLGHNFGLLDYRGVLLMTVGCIVWGLLLGWSRLRSASVWPAVIAHGALNASAGLFALVYLAGSELPLPLVNPLGVAGWIAAGIAVTALAAAGQFKHQPELAPPVQR